MNGKTKITTAVASAAAAVIAGGLVLGTVRDWRWWEWRWEAVAAHEVLATDGKRTYRLLAQNIQENRARIVRIEIDAKFSDRLTVEQAIRECEQGCSQLIRDQAILLSEGNLLRDRLKRILQK